MSSRPSGCRRLPVLTSTFSPSLPSDFHTNFSNLLPINSGHRCYRIERARGQTNERMNAQGFFPLKAGSYIHSWTETKGRKKIVRSILVRPGLNTAKKGCFLTAAAATAAVLGLRLVWWQQDAHATNGPWLEKKSFLVSGVQSVVVGD